jgi:hypothetical protein
MLMATARTLGLKSAWLGRLLADALLVGARG